jgi:two-component sensor histidine kinase
MLRRVLTKYSFRAKKVYWAGTSLRLDRERGQYILKSNSIGEPILDEVNIDHAETFDMRLVSASAKQLGGSISLQKHPETDFITRFPNATASETQYNLEVIFQLLL